VRKGVIQIHEHNSGSSGTSTLRLAIVAAIALADVATAALAIAAAAGIIAAAAAIVQLSCGRKQVLGRLASSAQRSVARDPAERQPRRHERAPARRQMLVLGRSNESFHFVERQVLKVVRRAVRLKDLLGAAVVAATFLIACMCSRSRGSKRGEQQRPANVALLPVVALGCNQQTAAFHCNERHDCACDMSSQESR
jgi:hypothetical protein